MFRVCHFGLIAGRASENDLPKSRFENCSFQDFENSARTTNAILRLELPTVTRVLLTMLKKLFAQAGRGRRELALSRGLDARESEAAPAALDLLRKRGFITRSRQGAITVWLPARTLDVRSRALAILAAPTASQDPLIIESMQL